MNNTDKAFMDGALFVVMIFVLCFMLPCILIAVGYTMRTNSIMSACVEKYSKADNPTKFCKKLIEFDADSPNML